MGQIDDIQAQLGNLLSGLPSKLQKVDPSFLDESSPPFEGAIASDSSGQFYISDDNGSGGLVWKVVKDVTARQENLVDDAEEVTLKFEVPQGFSSGTISFGSTFTGDVSVFVQYEAPPGDDIIFYATAVSNITQTGFDLHLSDSASEVGGIVHITAKKSEGTASLS